MTKIMMDHEKLEIAVARYEKAEARVKELEAGIKGLADSADIAIGIGRDVLAERARLVARVGVLEGALKPFAGAGKDLDENDGADRQDAWESSAAMSVTLGDFRNARQALAGNSNYLIETNSSKQVAEVIAAARLVAEGKAVEVATTPLRLNNLRKTLSRLDSNGGGDAE